MARIPGRNKQGHLALTAAELQQHPDDPHGAGRRASGRLTRLGVFVVVAGLTCTPVLAETLGSVSGTVKIKKRWGTGRPEHVFVLLESKTAPAPGPPAPKHHEVLTKDKEFRPRYLIVRPGDTVTFPNQDRISHNVFSLTPGSSFDLGVYKTGDVPARTFTEPGVVKLYCNIHPDMACFIMVTASPWTAITARDGKFEFGDVPPGNYEVYLWSLVGETRQAVTVTNGQPTTLDVEIDASKYRDTPHLDKHGKPYPRSTEDDENY